MQLALPETPYKGSQDAQLRSKTIYTPDSTSYRFGGGFTWQMRPGSARCVCRGCGDGFNSVTAFDKHQRLRTDGGTICLDPADLGMVRLPDGWWVTALSDRTFDS